MPKIIFYLGTAFCLFIALSSAAESIREADGGPVSFVAMQSGGTAAAARPGWAILVALIAGVAAASIFVRMAALLAPRHLFGAFLALFAAGGGIVSLSWLLLLQARYISLFHHGRSVSPASLQMISEAHFAGFMMLGYFLSLTLLALRPYFRIQASRFLSALVFFPLPLFLLILAQELFVTASPAPLPAATPASLVFFGVTALLFFSIALHCIRHRHLFLETTNLRELLDGRVDPAGRIRRPIGGVAFDL